MKWEYIDPDKVIPSVFGLKKVYACKVLRANDNRKRKRYSQEGWFYISDVLDFDPITREPLKQSSWYIFAATGI